MSAGQILVVDDNPLIVNVLNGLLASEDYEVYSSANGLEALKVLQDNSVDVIVCDVMMPEMDGYRLLEVLRDQAAYAHIPFVFLTALGQEEEVFKGRATGADDYIVKPFDPRELLALVQGKVKRSQSIREHSKRQNDQFCQKVLHTLSHEFRTPLVAINTGTELLMGREQEKEDEKAQNLLAAIQRGGQRLERLVNDFMLLQQIEAGLAEKMKESKASRSYAISEIFEPFIQSKLDSLKEQKFFVERDSDDKDARVRVYEPQVLEALERILDNAVKFSPETKEICFRSTVDGDSVLLEILDRGIGIDPEQTQKVLSVFGQVDREKIEQQGSGLGLPIAARYLEINGARIEFAAREGGGSCVGIRFTDVA